MHTNSTHIGSRVAARGLAFHETATTDFGFSLRLFPCLKAEVKHPPSENRNSSPTVQLPRRGALGCGPAVRLIPERWATHLKRIAHVFSISDNKQEDTWPITL